jgi:uncharacterized protein (DUF1697 family)
VSVHVALLRGINVGTAKRVAMADLRKVAESLGHTNVRTLLNSGNLVFTAKSGKPPAIGRALEQAIASELGVTSRVTVLTAAELEAIARANPLVKQATDPTRLLVTILADASLGARLGDIGKAKWKPEAFALGERAAYLWCPPGQLDSPLAKAVFKALGDGATSRNWATIEKLRALASNPPTA